MKVRVNSLYKYNPNGWDTVMATAGNTLRAGQVVKVVNLPSAPPANTMGQCYVAEPQTGKFICMVSTGNLDAVSAVEKRLYTQLATKRQSQNAPMLPVFLTDDGGARIEATVRP